MRSVSYFMRSVSYLMGSVSYFMVADRGIPKRAPEARYPNLVSRYPNPVGPLPNHMAKVHWEAHVARCRRARHKHNTGKCTPARPLVIASFPGSSPTDLIK